MPRSRLPRLASITDGSFEPSRRNPISLRNDEPLDSNLKQIKVGEGTSPLELSEDELRINGDLFLNGNLKSHRIETENDYLDIVPNTYTSFQSRANSGKLDLHATSAGTGCVFFHSDVKDFSFISEGSNRGVIEFGSITGGTTFLDQIEFDLVNASYYFRPADSSSDSFKIDVDSSGVTTLSTTDSDGAVGHLTLDVDGSLIFDPADGKYIAKNNGTEFSATDSAYAGMVLGYTCLRNLDNSGGAETITIGTSFATLQTDAGNDVKVTFVAPPSGNVEIVFSALVDAFSKIVYFALSDNATYNELDATHTYDAKCITVDETDESVVTIRWFLTGLTAGSSYTYFIGAKVSSSTATIVHGVNRFNAHSPPITVKAIALPNTNYTGQ
tara:strand:- start:233 stop:1387 length:1155 start_codon:yes stop_codon:yes gene_type:complete